MLFPAQVKSLGTCSPQYSNYSGISWGRRIYGRNSICHVAKLFNKYWHDQDINNLALWKNLEKNFVTILIQSTILYKTYTFNTIKKLVNLPISTHGSNDCLKNFQGHLFFPLPEKYCLQSLIYIHEFSSQVIPEATNSQNVGG